MPSLIGFGAGAGATALAVVLGLAYWPQALTSPISGKSAVSRPVFVVGAASAKPEANSPAPASANAQTALPTMRAAAIDSTDASAIAKLADALRTDPTVTSSTQPMTRSITVAAAAPAPVSETARRYSAQGLVALASGDVVGARLFLERAAEIGDVRALMALGESYDPATLVRMGALGIKGDAVKARDYYSKALAAGMGAARERMAALVSE
jgi:TPR repeat protein